MNYQVNIRNKICDAYQKPDIGILLDSQRETIFKQKSQLNMEQLENLRI
jgi:hypothetical protein